MDLKNLLLKNREIDILAYIPDGVALINADGIIDRFNNKFASFFKCDKTLINKADINDYIESGFDLIKQTALNGQSVVGKVKNEEAKNTYLELTAEEVQNCYVVSFRDVTQNYKTVTNLMIEQKNFKKNNLEKNNFIVKLSNEFKAPVQLIVGFSQSMIEGLGGIMSEKQDKYVKIINKNDIDTLYFINKVLELAKTESSLFEYDNQIFDVVNASRVICKDIEHQDLSKNLVWKFEASEISKKTIFSDEGAISLILRNILEVSSSMTDIGFISVKLSYPTRDIVLDRGFEVPENEDDYNEKKYLMFTISDTSSGYSDVELEDIFDPYLQVDKPNKKNIIRFIALASAKNVVNHLKGDIWVESTLMQGSTYNVIIPIAR